MARKQERVRGSDPVQIRNSESGEPCISGYAMVYYTGEGGTEYRIREASGNYPAQVERMMPGCADELLDDPALDVAGLFNHDSNYVLGRSSSGTLRLSLDDRGLRYEIDPPSSRADVVEAVERGDVTGSSFAFYIDEEERIEDRTNNQIIYEIRKISRLQDVGPVTYPAYKGTESVLRSAETFDEEQNERTDNKPDDVDQVFADKSLRLRRTLNI